MAVQHPPRTFGYGAYALACVVVSCFLQLAMEPRLDASPLQLTVTFVLGALYAILGILEDSIVERLGCHWARRIFYLLSVIAVTLLYVSPVRGFFSILILPVCGWALFALPGRWAAAACTFFYLALLGVFARAYGIKAVPGVALSFLGAFAFTIAFTLVTKQALRAKEQANALSAQLTEANERLQAQASQAEELATTRERNRLAREIHDGVGHYLTVVKTQLDAAAALLPDHPEKSRAAVVTAARLTGEALDDVRRSVGTLRADTDRRPLTDAIAQLVSDAAPPTRFEVIGSPKPLTPQLHHALFRAAQEALTNVRKHSGATQALLTLDFSAVECIRLCVRDNGRGPPTAPRGQSGFGLTGLRERFALLNGKVETGLATDGGFVLTVEVPA